jgi:hypothetical protein
MTMRSSRILRASPWWASLRFVIARDVGSAWARFERCSRRMWRLRAICGNRERVSGWMSRVLFGGGEVGCDAWTPRS